MLSWAALLEGSYSPLGIQYCWNKQHVSPTQVAVDVGYELDILWGLLTRKPGLASTIMEIPLHLAQASVNSHCALRGGKYNYLNQTLFLQVPGHSL